MDQTAIKAGTPLAPAPLPEPVAEPTTQRRVKPWYIRVLEPVASLRVTVVLFCFSIFLVYYGTWAQKDASIWTVVNEYFRSFIVWIPFKILFMHMFDDVPGSLPFPGGWLLGGLLAVNLLAAHAVRFKLTWKRSGILLIHAGIILMMVGELVTGLFAIEGRMTIKEGEKTKYVEHDRDIELAIVDRSHPERDQEIVVPATFLARDKVVRDEQLSFDIEVVDYMMNSDVHRPQPGDKNPATAGSAGRTHIAVSKPEAVGVDSEAPIEMPSAYVTLKEKDGKVIGTYLVSTWFTFLERPLDEVTVAGKKYALSLRPRRSQRDFTIELLEFRHDKYDGTEIAKNFSSKIRLTDPKTNEDREVLIYMNNPLRFREETFYQNKLHPLAKGTVLQVVNNPGWRLPYLSCLLVTLGMLVHFGLHLTEFLRRRFAV